MNGGACLDDVNAYTCNCTSNYNGTNCQIGKAHLVGYGEQCLYIYSEQ